MEEYVFNQCHEINDLLISKEENKAREVLIKLLDYHADKEISYSPIVNHLIRETGLFPYLDFETSNWNERYLIEAFKVNIGDDSPKTLHREQSLLLKKLLSGKNIAVSAPTSFGKSFVIDAFIKIKSPKNVVIIVPTIALTDETRRRLFKKFAGDYKIITTADSELSEKNIFIFPQERAFGYINKISEIDILIVDEFYKASSNFDKERSPSLVKAIIQLGEISKQKYFLAPNISSLGDNPFTRDMDFLKLDFNTVYLEKHELYKEIIDNNQKSSILVDILQRKQTKSLIYAGTYSNIEKVSTIILSSLKENESILLKEFSNWLGKNYDYNWILPKLIERGTGIHNGRLHRSLSQIQVKLFEEKKNGINNIISTSSIIEGVNTSAENVIIWMNKNGNSNLNDFTYRNIIGRGGRMFKHFIGKIYILDSPPKNEETQLNIPFPEEILGTLDEAKYEKVLTKEQVSKIILHQEEMAGIIGIQAYEKLRNENAFQSSNSDLLKKIAVSLYQNPDTWNGLSFLNTYQPDKWDHYLYKLIELQPGNWDVKYSSFVSFIKILSQNWYKSIPQLLKELEPYDIGVDDFFKLERNVTFKFSALVKDFNLLQKEILKTKSYDISRFINWISNAFLPVTVFQLEEYGLPRIISKKIQSRGLINFVDQTDIHNVINIFNDIGIENIKSRVKLDEFDLYILDYFYDGIKTKTNAR